jgi:23S rRNA pseudouridine1911/1915/1917 synthase
VFEDDDIVVVEKPAGLLTASPTPESDRNNLADLLKRRPGATPVFVVHRIDLETSGLVVFAKTAHANRELSNRFREHDLERAYLAVVAGAFPADLKVIDRPGRWAARRHARGGPGTIWRSCDVGCLPARDRPYASDSLAHGRGRNTGYRRRTLRAPVRAGAAADGAARDAARLRAPGDGRSPCIRERVATRSRKVAHRNNVAQQRYSVARLSRFLRFERGSERPL